MWQPTPGPLLGQSLWMEEPGRLQSLGLQRARHGERLTQRSALMPELLPTPDRLSGTKDLLPQLLDVSPACGQLPLSSGNAAAEESGCIAIVTQRATCRRRGEGDSGDGLGVTCAAPLWLGGGWPEPQTVGGTRGSRRTAKTEAGDPRTTDLRCPGMPGQSSPPPAPRQ